jgi:hypothetical protein
MYGRYGVDKLNLFLAVVLLVLAVVSAFVTGTARLVIQVIETLIFVLFLFRFLSKNTFKRRTENDKFMKIVKPAEKYFNVKYRQLTDKNFKYFKCPKCSATLRVPKNKGSITVTCPVCRNKFDKKT